MAGIVEITQPQHIHLLKSPEGIKFTRHVNQSYYQIINRFVAILFRTTIQRWSFRRTTGDYGKMFFLRELSTFLQPKWMEIFFANIQHNELAWLLYKMENI